VTGHAVPAWYRVSDSKAETRDTVTLTLAPAGPPIGAHRPGQFTMLYAFGVGEVPVSISGAADGPELIQTIRAVGAVSSALYSAVQGQLIGVRGPFGTDWGVADAAGRDLLLVAGGIGLAPLRPALLAALGRRASYRRIVVLIGARTPADLLFGAEMMGWHTAGAEVHVTVDQSQPGWTGNVGVVTQLLDRAHLDPAGTTALVCGPEVMMRLTARALVSRGLPAAQIRLSLERNMRCGIAECGHCQLGPFVLCRDGPVVSYQRAAPALAVREM